MTHVLLRSIHIGLALLLVAPLIVTFDALSPFIVGKSLYSRVLIEVMAVLWVILMIRNPTFRPPRSWILLAFAAYAVVALLSAVWGVSFTRSIWSTYQRMMGVWDLWHWLLIVVVAVSVIRSARVWRLLLNWQLGIALILSLFALAQVYGAPLVNVFAKCRVEATLGNPSFLAAFTVLTVPIAIGFLVRSYLPSNESQQVENIGGGVQGHHISRVFWVITAALALWVLFQTGTRDALLGMVAGALAMPLGLALWGNRDALKPVMLASGGILLAVAGLFTFDQTIGFPVAPSCEGQIASNRLVRTSLGEESIAVRLMSVKAGVRGFLDRPLLGWGPENFASAFDRHVEAPVFRFGSFVQDQAHNKIIEELTTKGILGIFSYLLLWSALVWALVRRRRPPGDEILAYAVLGAMAGYFVQNLFLFDTPATILQWVLLVAWIASQSRAREAEQEQGSLFSALASATLFRNVAGIAKTALAPSWSRGVIAVSVVVLLGLSLYFMNYRPYIAAQSLGESFDPRRPMSERLISAQYGFDSFPSLANWPRRMFILQIAQQWPLMTPGERADALELVIREVGKGLKQEPQNAELLISTLLFLQTVIGPTEATAIVDPMLTRLQTLAPKRVETHQLLATQALQQKRYHDVIRIAEEYEAMAPGTEMFFEHLKRSARENLLTGSN